MTLKKQLNVLPSGVNVVVVENEKVLFNCSITALKQRLRVDTLHSSSFVSRVLPVSEKEVRILIKTKTNSIAVKEDLTYES